MSIAYVSDHFAWAEAACHDGTEVPIELQPNARRLANLVLEPIREKIGGPIVVISWYRTREYNVRIGGAEKSQHLWALAADIRPADISDLPLLKGVIEKMLVDGELPGLGGFGVYTAWLHVDARVKNPPDHVARWYGRGVGSEQ